VRQSTGPGFACQLEKEQLRDTVAEAVYVHLCHSVQASRIQFHNPTRMNRLPDRGVKVGGYRQGQPSRSGP